MRRAVVVAVAALLVAAAPVSARVPPRPLAGQDEMIDMGPNGNGGRDWKDPSCDVPAVLFDVRLYEHSGYQGDRWRFCSDHRDLCWVPYGSDSTSGVVCDTLGQNTTTANDKATSYRMPNTGPGACSIELRRDRDFQGPVLIVHLPGNDPSLVSESWNDKVSSVRRVCP